MFINLIHKFQLPLLESTMVFFYYGLWSVDYERSFSKEKRNRGKKTPAMRVEDKLLYKKSPFHYNVVVQDIL